jgi:hypothetical protein
MYREVVGSIIILVDVMFYCQDLLMYTTLEGNACFLVWMKCIAVMP